MTNEQIEFASQIELLRAIAIATAGAASTMTTEEISSANDIECLREIARNLAGGVSGGGSGGDTIAGHVGTNWRVTAGDVIEFKNPTTGLFQTMLPDGAANAEGTVFGAQS